MKSAYQTSGKIFEQASKLYQPGVLEQLHAIQPGEITVVRGQYDHIERLLDTIKVPYKMILPEELATASLGRAVFVNCKSYDNLTPRVKEAVESIVSGGGRLVSTDWSLSFVGKLFPGKLKFERTTSDDVVEIQCPGDLGRKLIGFNYVQCHPKWWLEGSSHVYSPGTDVVPVITSNEMEGKYGHATVAAAFRHGRGEVFHFISHLELQRTKSKSAEDSMGLDAFLEKLKISKTEDMDEDVKVAELEAAYSTLNTLAYLCLPTPLLEVAMNSVMTSKSKSVAKSKGLL